MHPDNIHQMLKEIGLDNIEELFSDIPSGLRIKALDLPEGKSELEIKSEIKKILEKNKAIDQATSFLGTGIYNHYIPSAVKAIIERSEFYTSYTPYQPEASQGMLQALFEYQSLMSELLDIDVVNCSMYDAHTALGEAALMCTRVTNKKEFIIPRAIHWEKKSVLGNYTRGIGLKIKEVGYNRDSGELDLNKLGELVNKDTAGVYIENPNLFGIFEEKVQEIREIAKKALLVVGVNPLSLGIVKGPGEYGADIVVGDAQSLGNPMSLGGPLLGIFGCKREYLRKMPGRVIGLTHDIHGDKAFCMTLQTREQHIRREKATSNICSNESLCAIASAVYLSLLGRHGLRKLAMLNISRAKELARKINSLDGFKAPLFSGYHFNEFVASYPMDLEKVDRHLLARGIFGGVGLKKYFSELGNSSLYCVTEMNTNSDFDRLLGALGDLL